MTTFDQFRDALSDDERRKELGIDLDEVEAEWIADDEALVEVRYREWLAQSAANVASPGQSGSTTKSRVPGRVSGFVWGLLAVLLGSLVAGIVSLVLASTASKYVRAGEKGRGLINAAFVLAYSGIGVSAIILLALIGLWIRLH